MTAPVPRSVALLDALTKQNNGAALTATLAPRLSLFAPGPLAEAVRKQLKRPSAEGKSKDDIEAEMKTLRSQIAEAKESLQQLQSATGNQDTGSGDNGGSDANENGGRLMRELELVAQRLQADCAKLQQLYRSDMQMWIERGGEQMMRLDDGTSRLDASVVEGTLNAAQQVHGQLGAIDTLLSNTSAINGTTSTGDRNVYAQLTQLADSHLRLSN
ncbi:hypothetical protein GQ42DRAFT_39278 [Ramicandelaber brevisporus]|nr:hypothetical protein GQ42DRAFT_39278 [Ramicandelaber brevisporus]